MTRVSVRRSDSAPHVVVVGTGIAGLTAALHALDAGCQVTVVTKATIAESNTRYAQGGLAAVTSADDRTDDHVDDTLRAGAHLGDERAVRVLVGDASSRVEELVRVGVGFDTSADGTFAAGLEAAHSFARVLHAGGDATGLAIESALVVRVHESSALVLDHTLLVDVLLTGGRVVGVEVLRAGALERIFADAVVLATGGAGRLYAHTTNPAVATGDGIAAALRAGAEVADLEFVQFHPTVLPATADADPFLISEAVRGEGAVLRDVSGRRFAFDAHPDGELAPRDVVARAIDRAMVAQHGEPVLLDATMLGEDFLARRFPTIDRAVRERGLDWSRSPIPVTPAAHYLMGGVVTDLDGRTSVPRLYAVGEVARTGVHGANRLASNSLLEGAVFGARAGDAVAGDVRSGSLPAPLRRPSPQPTVPRPKAAASDADSPAPASFTRGALQQLMWTEVGLTRTAAGLERAASVLSAWRTQKRMLRTTADHEDANLLLVAAHVVEAALARTASVGAHHRADDAIRTQEEPGSIAVSHPSDPHFVLHFEQEGAA